MHDVGHCIFMALNSLICMMYGTPCIFKALNYLICMMLDPVYLGLKDECCVGNGRLNTGNLSIR